MDRFNALGRGTQLMGIAALLLFIDLFLPWQDLDSVDPTFSGWRGVGVILGILVIILIAWVIVRLASVNIPVPVSTAMTAALLGTLILILAVIKFLTILGDEQTIWAWVGLVLAFLVAIGSFRTVQEAGGVETLRTEASSMTSQGPAPAAAAPAATAPAAEPAAAEPPAAPPPESAPAEPAEGESPTAEERPAS